jgi:hypothetical protein
MRRVLMAVMESLQSFYGQLSNTGQAWSLKSDYALQVTSNTSDYLLAIDQSYGKPIQVLSYYPSNPSYVQRQIDFVEFQDMNFNWPFPTNIASWLYTDGSNCTAMRMAFYYKDDGSRWVRVLPQPQLSAQYLVTFASGDWAATANIADSPVLSQFQSLVQTRAALSILPSCQWDGSNQRYNMDHRRELAVALKNDEERIQDQFDRYCRNIVDDKMGIRASSFDGMSEWSSW